MGYILIIGHDQDICCQSVREQLHRRNKNIVYLPENRLFPDLDFAWHVENDSTNGFLRYDNQSTSFDQIDAVLARGYGVAVTPEQFATKDGRYLSSEWNALSVAWLWKLPCFVCNRLRPELWYKTQLNAPHLASLLRDSELQPIPTLATTQFKEVRRFIRQCRGRAVYSPFNRSLTYQIDDNQRATQLENLAGTLPFQILDIPHGSTVRAFVVAGRVFSHIDTASSSIPSAISDQCVKLARSLGLTFCRVDLIAADDGNWFATGLDRMPLLHDVDDPLRAAVSHALADMLCGNREAA